MRFLAILLSLDHTLSLKLQTMISLRQYLTSSTGNICKKIFSGPNFGTKLGFVPGSKIRFFSHFLKFASINFLDIVQDCSL